MITGPPIFQVEALWKETGIYTMERGDTDEIIQQCNALGGKFLVMEDPIQNGIIGTSWMTFDGRRIHLHHFAIKPSYQGKGLGRNLALESLEFARETRLPSETGSTSGETASHQSL